MVLGRFVVRGLGVSGSVVYCSVVCAVCVRRVFVVLCRFVVRGLGVRVRVRV